MMRPYLFLALCASTALSVEAEDLDLSLKDVGFNSAQAAWQGFELPSIAIHKLDGVEDVTWDAVTPSTIAVISERVARLLYPSSAEAPKLKSLSINLKEMKGVAYKDGNFDGASIFVSREYLVNYRSKHGAQAAYDELVGVLFHEIAHAYQYDDHNYAEIGPIIEGIADLVRLKAGYIPAQARKVGGNYSDGYKTTAFYLDWLDARYQSDFLVAINQSLDPYDEVKWSWSYFAKKFNVPLEKSWQEYQLAIKP